MDTFDNIDLFDDSHLENHIKSCNWTKDWFKDDVKDTHVAYNRSHMCDNEFSVYMLLDIIYKCYMGPEKIGPFDVHDTYVTTTVKYVEPHAIIICDDYVQIHGKITNGIDYHPFTLLTFWLHAHIHWHVNEIYDHPLQQFYKNNCVTFLTHVKESGFIKEEELNTLFEIDDPVKQLEKAVNYIKFDHCMFCNKPVYPLIPSDRTRENSEYCWNGNRSSIRKFAMLCLLVSISKENRQKLPKLCNSYSYSYTYKYNYVTGSKLKYAQVDYGAPYRVVFGMILKNLKKYREKVVMTKSAIA